MNRTFTAVDLQDVLHGFDIINARQRDIKRLVMTLGRAIVRDHALTNEQRGSTDPPKNYEVRLAISRSPLQALFVKRTCGLFWRVWVWATIEGKETYIFSNCFRHMEAGRDELYHELPREYVLDLWSALPGLIAAVAKDSAELRQDLAFWQNLGSTHPNS